jgi:hypothetical protein
MILPIGHGFGLARKLFRYAGKRFRYAGKRFRYAGKHFRLFKKLLGHRLGLDRMFNRLTCHQWLRFLILCF